MRFLVLIFCISSIFELAAQNLFNERIRKLLPDKKGVFLKRGIFHNGKNKLESSISAIRYHYDEKNSYERLVIDCVGDKVPKVYGSISLDEKKVYVDFFKTSLPESFYFSGKSKFVKSVNFFSINNEMLSTEIDFKEEMSLEIFYLENPGRLVIDIKK